jgi:hypothetical protein
MDFFRGSGFFGNKQPGNGSEVTPRALLAARRYQLKAFLPRLPRFPRETFLVNREANQRSVNYSPLIAISSKLKKYPPVRRVFFCTE